MFAYLTRLQRNRKGFTLIELMVVVVILGILAGAAIMTLGGNQTQQATQARIDSDVATIQSAVEFYRLDHNNEIPENVSQLLVPDEEGFGPYLRFEPKHPIEGGEYVINQVTGLVTADPPTAP